MPIVSLLDITDPRETICNSERPSFDR